jgi:hypothetical protein
VILLAGIVIGLIVFLYQGLGFLLLNAIILGFLELLGIMFSGLIGFILLAFFVKLALSKGK